MTSNRHVTRLILVAVTAMVLVAGGFGLVASGSMHLPDDIDVDYDYNQSTNPNVDYGQVVGINDANEDAVQIEENGYYVVEPKSGKLDDSAYETSRGLLTVAGSSNVLLLNDTFNFTQDGTEHFGLRVDTEAYAMYDVDPRGEYRVRGLYQNTLQVPAQSNNSGGSGNLYVGQAEADQKYVVYVENADTGNAEGASDNFSAGTRVTDLFVPVSNGTDDGDTFNVYLKNASALPNNPTLSDIKNAPTLKDESVNSNGQLVVQPTVVSVTTSAGEDDLDSATRSGTVQNTELNTVFADWALESAFSPNDGGIPGAKNDGLISQYDEDTRIFTDYLAIGTPNDVRTERGVWVGQKLVIAGNIDPAQGQEFYIERVGSGGNTTTIKQVQLENSSTVNEDQIVIDTGYPNVQVDNLQGDFQLVSGDETIFKWTVQKQRVEAEFNKSTVNLNTETTSANLTVSGNRIGYDLIIESNNLDATELSQVIVDDGDVNVEVEDSDEGLVRVSNVADDAVQENVTFNFAGQDAAEYDFNISVADSNAETTANISVVFGATGSADFSQGTYEIDRGDKVAIPITLEETDTGTFRIAEQKYNIEFGFNDSDNSGNVTIVMDTYIADEYKNDSVEVEDVFNIRGGNITSSEKLPPVNGNFEVGQYTMELAVNGEDSDLATLNVSPRESEAINTWVLPKNSGASSGELTLERLRKNGTQQGVVAYGDTLVVEVKMSGIFNSRMFNNSTNPTALVNRSLRAEREGMNSLDQAYLDANGINQTIEELNMRIVGEAEPSRPKPYMELENADRLRVDPQNESFYVFFKTDKTGLFNFYNDDFTVQKEDKLSDYTVQAQFTDEYKFLGDDDSENLTENFTLVERKVTVNNLEPVVVNQTTLDTKYGLPGSSNVTVSGKTKIAPGTKLDVRVVSEGLSPFRQVRTTTVTQNGFVNGSFDLANLDPGRNMTIQFFPADEPVDAVITEPPTAPVITNVSVNTPVVVGEGVKFSANVSNASGGVSYSWDFGDGTNSSLPEPVHAYEKAGTYNVTLEVTKPQSGLTDTREIEVFVEERPNQPPEIDDLIGPTSIQVGQAAEFGVVATDDGAQKDLQYNWSFGNGNTAAGITASNTYAAEGTYTVTVTVTDADGAQASADQTVEVVNPDVDGNQTNQTMQSYNLTVTAEDGSTGEVIPGAAVAIDNTSTDGIDTGGQTNQSGVYSTELNQGTYTVQVSATGYQQFTVENIPLDSDRQITATLQPESQNTGNNTSNNSSNTPDQPGFTLLLGALVLVAVGAFVYYRREVDGDSSQL